MADTDRRVRDAIRKAMTQRGLSQADLARQLDVSPAHVSRMLSGATGKIPESLIRVLDALDLEICVCPKAPDG